MKEQKPSAGPWIALPLILGIASFAAFAVYYYSANHAPYQYTDVIIAGPVLSFVGVVISVITRKSRTQSPTLWFSGLFICLFGFAVCVCVIFLLMMVMVAAWNGTWL
jgi:hypothetical protein